MNHINRFIAASCVLAASLLAQQSPVTVVNTVADLLAYEPQGVATNRLVMLSGYYAANDGGEGEFRHSVYPYITNYGTVFPAYGYVAGVGPVWLRQTRNNAPYNVKWFGAVGNGVTDDTAEIQAALTAGAGKAVYFPPGTYLVDDAGAVNSYAFLQLGSAAFDNTTIQGEGRASIIKAKSTSTRKYLLNIGSTDGAGAGTVFPANVTIRGLTFDANAQARGGASSYLSAIFAYPKLAGEPVTFTVEGCTFVNIGYKALVVGGVSKATVKDCEFYGPLYAPDTTASVLLFGGNIQTAAVTVQDCHFADIYGADVSNLAIQGIYASDYASLLVSDCTFTNVAKAVDFRQSNAAVVGGTVSGGTVDGCAGDVASSYLFLAQGTAGNILTNVAFSGVTIKGAPHQALFTGVYTEGLRISDCSSTAPLDAVVGNNSYIVSAFRPQTGCNNSVISDCYFGIPKTGSGGSAYGYGVYCIDGGSRTVLDNVAFDGATYLARYDSGDATPVQLVVRSAKMANRNATTYLFVNQAGGSNNTGGGYVKWDGKVFDSDSGRYWYDQQVLNVFDFGAKGDGTTDDTAAIQAAFNALPTVGSYTPGTVHFPPGMYKITSAISVPPVCRITGDGPFASQVIQYTAGANGFELAAASDTEEHLTIQDLWIMYAGVTNDGGTALDLSADDGHWDVRNVYITSTGTYDWLFAIKLQNTKFANFDHVWINNVDQGIQSIGTMNNATFSNVRVSNANGTGWLFAGANYSSFIGCQTEDIALERDGFGFSMTNLSTCTFTSCASEDNGVTGTSAGTAMQLDNPISVTINGYYITNCRTNAALTTAGYTTQYVNGNGISITDGNNLSLSGIRGSTVEGYGYCVDSGDVITGWSSFGNIMVGTWGEYNSGAIGIKPDLHMQYNDHTVRMGNPDEYYGIYFDAASSRVGIGTINTTSGRELEIRSSPPDIYMTYATSGSSRYSAASDAGNIVPKAFDEYGLGVTLAPFVRFEALPAASLPSLTATNAAVYAATDSDTVTRIALKNSDGTTNSFQTMGVSTLSVTTSAAVPNLTSTNYLKLLSATASKVLVTDANQYVTNSAIAIADVKTTRVGVVREVWVPASAMNPFATAGAAFTTNTWATTTDGQAIEAYDFDDATDEAVQFTLSLPLAWDGADPKMKIFWKPVSEEDGYTNIWGAVAGSLANNDDGGNTLGTPATVEDVGLTSTNKLHISPAITVDVGNTPTAGDMIWFKVYRDANAALDELVGDARLLGVMIQYTETTTEPSAW